jgi:hypothetical protein
MDDVFNKIEMELIAKAITTVVELGVNEGKITNEEEKEDIIEDAVTTIIAYKTANYNVEDTMDAEDLGEFMGQYAIYKFIDLDDEELNEIGLALALGMTNVNDFEEVAKLNTINELATHYKTLDMNKDSIETVATLKRLYEIIDDEKDLEEFFDLVNE